MDKHYIKIGSKSCICWVSIRTKSHTNIIWNVARYELGRAQKAAIYRFSACSLFQTACEFWRANFPDWLDWHMRGRVWPTPCSVNRHNYIFQAEITTLLTLPSKLQEKQILLVHVLVHPKYSRSSSSVICSQEEMYLQNIKIIFILPHF